MKVFISWSGERSRRLAVALHKWLPDIIQALEPWFSPTDIEKGTRWPVEIAAQLSETNAGIICLTRENLTAPWINFEAGALSKTINESFVCPYLLDLSPSEVSGPLSQFQLTVSDRDDTLKLVKTLNNALGEGALPEDRVDRTFQRCWSELEKEVSSIRKMKVDVTPPRRTGEEMLEEVLVTVRAIGREMVDFAANLKAQHSSPIEKDTGLIDIGEAKTSPLEEPLTDETLRQLWPRIMSKVGSLFARDLEKAGLPAIFGPNTLVFRFPIAYNRAKDHCQGNTARLEETLRKFTGKTWNLRFETLPAPAPNPAMPSPPEVEPSPPPRPPKDLHDETENGEKAESGEEEVS